MTTRFYPLLLLCLLFAPGCAAGMAGSDIPNPGYYEEGYAHAGGDADDEPAAGMVVNTPADGTIGVAGLPAREVAEAEALDVRENRRLFSRLGSKRADKAGPVKRKTATAEPATRAPDAAGTTPTLTPADPARPATDAAADAEPAIDQQPDPHGRHIIYQASMQVGVFDLAEAMERAEELPERFQGYVQTMSLGSLVLRIPASRLKEAMTALGEFGIVEARSLQSQDVTDEYVDLETRIHVLRETQAQLLELLRTARNVKEALAVRAELDGITMELELALGRVRQLANLIGFSTLTLTLVERGPHSPVPTSNDPFPWVDALGVEATEWK